MSSSRCSSFSRSTASTSPSNTRQLACSYCVAQTCSSLSSSSLLSSLSNSKTATSSDCCSRCHFRCCWRSSWSSMTSVESSTSFREMHVGDNCGLFRVRAASYPLTRAASPSISASPMQAWHRRPPRLEKVGDSAALAEVEAAALEATVQRPVNNAGEYRGRLDENFQDANVSGASTSTLTHLPSATATASSSVYDDYADSAPNPIGLIEGVARSQAPLTDPSHSSQQQPQLPQSTTIADATSGSHRALHIQRTTTALSTVATTCFTIDGSAAQFECASAQRKHPVGNQLHLYFFYEFVAANTQRFDSGLVDKPSGNDNDDCGDTGLLALIAKHTQNDSKLIVSLAEFAQRGCVHCHCRHQIYLLVRNALILNELALKIKQQWPTTPTQQDFSLPVTLVASKLTPAAGMLAELPAARTRQPAVVDDNEQDNAVAGDEPDNEDVVDDEDEFDDELTQPDFAVSDGEDDDDDAYAENDGSSSSSSGLVEFRKEPKPSQDASSATSDYQHQSDLPLSHQTLPSIRSSAYICNIQNKSSPEPNSQQKLPSPVSANFATGLQRHRRLAVSAASSVNRRRVAGYSRPVFVDAGFGAQDELPLELGRTGGGIAAALRAEEDNDSDNKTTNNYIADNNQYNYDNYYYYDNDDENDDDEDDEDRESELVVVSVSSKQKLRNNRAEAINFHIQHRDEPGLVWRRWARDSRVCSAQTTIKKIAKDSPQAIPEAPASFIVDTSSSSSEAFEKTAAASVNLPRRQAARDKQRARTLDLIVDFDGNVVQTLPELIGGAGFIGQATGVHQTVLDKDELFRLVAKRL